MKWFDLPEDEITDGSVIKALALLSVPLVVQQLVHIGNQVIDTFWVGRLGEEAMAAIGLTIPLMAIFFLIMFGLRVGTQIIVSQRTGEDDRSGARTATFNGAVIGLVTGLLLTGIIWQFAPTMIAILDPDPAVAPLAVTYFTAVALLYPMEGVSNALEAGFVGWGDSNVSLYSNVTFAATNLVLDPFLIFGWGPFPALGVQGAALAMVLGSAAGLLVATALTIRGRSGFTITRRNTTVNVGQLRSIVDLSVPKMLEGVGRQGAQVVIVAIVSAVGGAAALAVYLLGERLIALAGAPARGLEQANQTLVGQNLGAGSPSRARDATVWGAILAGSALTGLALFQWVFSGQITRLFVPEISSHGFTLAVDYLRILSLGYLAIGVSYAITGGFNGAGRTRTSMVARVLQYWGVRVPIAVVAAFGLGYGIYGVFWAITVSNVIGAIGLVAYYRYCLVSGSFHDRSKPEAAASD